MKRPWYRLSMLISSLLILTAIPSMAHMGRDMEKREYGDVEHEAACPKKAHHSGHDYKGVSEDHWEKTLSDSQKDAIKGLKISLKKAMAVAEASLQVKR